MTNQDRMERSLWNKSNTIHEMSTFRKDNVRSAMTRKIVMLIGIREMDPILVILVLRASIIVVTSNPILLKKAGTENDKEAMRGQKETTGETIMMTVVTKRKIAIEKEITKARDTETKTNIEATDDHGHTSAETMISMKKMEENNTGKDSQIVTITRKIAITRTIVIEKMTDTTRKVIDILVTTNTLEINTNEEESTRTIEEKGSKEERSFRFANSQSQIARIAKIMPIIIETTSKDDLTVDRTR
jgi:hypothetical protein